MQTAVEIAIKKIDEQIEIAQVCRIEAAKIKDETSMNRHYGKKIALVFMRQELVNLLELEKQQIIDAFIEGCSDNNNDGYEYYNQTFKSE